MSNKIVFKQIGKRQGLSEKIVAQIKALASEGNLQPGDKLPPEREFAVILGISRTSLREAFKTLAAMGLVKIIHGKGVFVQQPNEASELGILTSLILPSDPGAITDIFHIRMVIELLAIKWAVQRCAKTEMNKLLREIKDIQMAADNSKFSLIKFYEHDYRFHMLLAEAAHSPLLMSIMRDVMRYCAECRRKTLKKEYRPFSSIVEHSEIVEAIKRRDLQMARQAITRHITNVKANVLKE